MPHSVALILAGGEGSRMNMSIPKQYVMVDGHTVLQHTMYAFQRHQLVNTIHVVVSLQWQGSVAQMAKEAGITKFGSCISAGSSGYQSLRNGIASLARHESDDTIVLVHDAVRPLVSQDIISRNIAVCLSKGNAITALPSQESFMVIDKDDWRHKDTPSGTASQSFIPRESLLLAQTPQTFPLGELKAMMVQAEQRGITESQSLYTLANELGHTPLFAAQGETTNFKITYPQDILILQALLKT